MAQTIGECGYIQITTNEYTIMTKPSEKDIGSHVLQCSCVYEDGDDESACGRKCCNRAIYVECNEDCPTQEDCLNRNFRMNRKPSVLEKTVALQHYGEKGYGVKAVRDINDGEFIVEYVGEIISKSECSKRAQVEYSGNKIIYVITLQGDLVIDATTKGNIARFLNHSCKPNAVTAKWFVGGKMCIGIFASEDIKKGDEITIEYQFERFGKEKEVCLCGHKDVCRGYLSEDIGPMEPQERKMKNEVAQEVTEQQADVDPNLPPEETTPKKEISRHQTYVKPLMDAFNMKTRERTPHENSLLSEPPAWNCNSTDLQKIEPPNYDEKPIDFGIFPASSEWGIPATAESESMFADKTRNKDFPAATKVKTEKTPNRKTSFVCKICWREFAQAAVLKTHERTHGQDKQFGCTMCAKKFTKFYNMKRHEKTHSEGGVEKLFCCKVCGRKFTRAFNLMTHQRVHNGERPFSCKVCGRKFTQLHHVKRHASTHSGEMPFGCGICGRRFARSCNMKRHEKTHRCEVVVKCGNKSVRVEIINR